MKKNRITEKEIFKRLYREVRAYRGRMLLSVLTMILVAGLNALQAYMVKPLLDDIFVSKNELLLNIIPFALVSIFLLKGVCGYIYNYLLAYVGQKIVMNLRKKLFNHIQTSSVSFIQKFSTGEFISRVMADVELIRHAVSSSLINLIKDFFSAIGLICVVFYLNWKLALVTFVYLPLAALPVIYFGRKFRYISKKGQEQNAYVSSNLYEVITGVKIVKAFCMEPEELKKFKKNLYNLFRVSIKQVQMDNLNRCSMEFIGGLGIGIIIWYGGFQVINGETTAGAFFSFLTATIMLYDPIKRVSGINNTMQQALAAATRVYTLLDMKNEIVEKDNAGKLPLLKDEIEFKDIDFSYNGVEQVLNNISLTVPRGELLAIVGSSGSGKTSFVNLITRFYDVDKGEILIDGVDIRNATLKSLRSQIAMVTQQSILFNDTVRDNISYGTTCTDDELIKAAKDAHAWGFIKNLPDGLDTIIGEGGARLSGGEKQRLSIARAILNDAPILILDEATSALDTESEREVQRALANLMKNRTTFVIAHRLSTIRHADRIVVFDKGQIVDQGTHEELIVKDSVYKKFHEMQG